MKEGTLLAFGIAFVLAASLFMTWATTSVNASQPPLSQTITTQQLFSPAQANGTIPPTYHAETTENTVLIYLSIIYAIIAGGLISYARYGQEIRELRTAS